MPTELHQANVDLDALLELLGKNLYSSPAVAIRELVQNAHDACMRRRIEDPQAPEPAIELNPDAHRGVLEIHDTGSGLTRDEVLEYLATVGSGYSRQIRQQTQTEDVIGYFGLGFLSAYIVADKVEVWTTSYQTPNQTWHFTSSGGKRFTLDAADNRPVGTHVRLKLADQFIELSVEDVLTTLVQKYCCLLPIPIRLRDADSPLNNTLVPWQLEAETPGQRRTKVQLEFAQIFERHFEPICAFPLPDDNPLQARGLMWIQDASGYATSDYRNVALFVRNMHITHEARDLLPLWAGFAGCVVECRNLSPTASREDVQKDQHYEALSDFLSETLVAGLSDIAREQPENWRRILARHNQALLGAAIGDDRLFNLLSDQLKVPTTHGDLTIEQLLKKCSNHIYLRTDRQNNYEEVLFKARHVPVVSGYLFGASGFCEKYARVRNASLVRLGEDESARALFEDAHIDTAQRDHLNAILIKDNEKLVPCTFEPSYLPMIFMEDKEAKLKQRIESDDADKRIGTAALSLARLHTGKIEKALTRKALVNMDNPIIQRLARDKTPDAATKKLAQLIRTYMMTVCYDVSDDDTDFGAEAKRFFDDLTELAQGART
ncbi:MAG: ATP-binding protein [Gammaproteobacteria bacterium]